MNITGLEITLVAKKTTKDHSLFPIIVDYQCFYF